MNFIHLQAYITGLFIALFVLSALLHVCGCLPFELMMMKVVIPYDRRHKTVHSAFIMRTETEPKTAFFLAKPTETDQRQNFRNRNNIVNNTTGFHGSDAIPVIQLTLTVCIEETQSM